jgi:hypothetical protein
MRRTWLAGVPTPPAAVVNADPTLKIQAAFGSPPPSRVRFPVIPNVVVAI